MLADLHKAPDLINETPIEVADVRMPDSLPILPVFYLCTVHRLFRSPQNPSRPLSTLSYLYLISTRRLLTKLVFIRTVDHFLTCRSVCGLILYDDETAS
jgi:hypothetical protein